MKDAREGRKGAVCVWKTHLFCTQGSWKWVRARTMCGVLPLAEYDTWCILPPAQRERQRRAHLPCQNKHALKRRMKQRPAFQIILVVFNTILLRPLNIFLTWKHVAARGVVRKNMAGYKTKRVAEISPGAAHKRHTGSNKSARLITTGRRIICPEPFWLAPLTKPVRCY